MAGLEEKPVNHSTTLLAGLLQAAALYLVYLALSLTDLWGYLPPVAQLVAYGILALAMMMVIMGGLVEKGLWTLRASLKAAFLSVILLGIAAILAGPDSRRLLEIAVKPRAVFAYPVPEITMTVIPPDYSGAAGFTEQPDLENTPSVMPKPVPEGSEIIIRVANILYAPTLIAGQRRVEFLSAEEGGFVAYFTLKDETVWQIRDGSRVMGQWPIQLVADDAPIIERADFRQILTGDGLFGLSLHLIDDYGLQEVAIGLVRAGSDTDVLSDRTILAVSGLREFTGELYINLASSDLAGSQVDLIVDVTDQAGQKQLKILGTITLPVKEFSNPHARKIAEIRARLITEPQIRKKLARQLMALGLVPGDGQMPGIYYMALRSAYWRLTTPRHDDDITSAREILWDLAGQMEDGDGGQFGRDILALLAAVKLSLYQGQEGRRIKKQLQEIDKTIILFLRDQTLPHAGGFDPEAIDIEELRRIYGKILTHNHHKRYDQAVDLISYLEHGFIYRDRGILSEIGLKRFQIVSRARDTVSIIKQAQREVMSFVYKNTVKLELASLDTKGLNMAFNRDIDKWIAIQKKLGANVTSLGRILAKSGIDTTRLTTTASDLIRDVVQSMEAGDMGTAAQYQSEVLTLLNRLKNILNLKIQSN
ncbi:MAG: hypothetical protein COB49_05585 [Alphaproteobacteria bacterium]|nr:MAG: hypothetical protein COB49_05585 [Alphaproteobacteria bacterium]